MSIKATSATDTASLSSGLPNKYPITLMAWVYIPTALASAGSAWTWLCLSDGSDDNWVLQFKSFSGNYKFGTYSSTTGDIYGGSTVSKDTWHNLAITIDASGNVAGYLDGVVDAGVTGTLVSSIVATTFQLGHSIAGDNAPFSTVGASLGPVKIWNAQLNSTEIAAEQASYGAVRTSNLYGSWLVPNPTTLNDNSGNGHNLTRSGSSFTTDTDPPPLGTNAAVTGTAGTSALGTAAAAAVLALSGLVATGSVGNVSPPRYPPAVPGLVNVMLTAGESPSTTIRLTTAPIPLTAPAIPANVNLYTGDSPSTNVRLLPAGQTVAGATLALSGVAATGSPGSLGKSTTPAVTGVAATGAAGSVVEGDAEALTGNAATGSPGSLAQSSAIPLTGPPATGSPGTASPAGSVALSGAAASGAVGTVIPSGDFAATLSGVAATGSPGTLAPAADVPVSGAAATGSPGTLTATQEMTAALSGVAASSAPGSLAPAISPAATGAAGSTSPGTLVPSPAQTISGASATGTPGIVAPAAILPATGAAAAGSVGSVQLAQSLSGVAATGSPGSAAPAIVVALPGISVSGAAGVVSPSGAFDATLSGVVATATPGTVAPAADYAVALAGVAATAAPGTPAANLDKPVSGNAAAVAAGDLAPQITPNDLAGVVGISAAGFASESSSKTLAISGVAAQGYVGSVARELTGMSIAPIYFTVTVVDQAAFVAVVAAARKFSVSLGDVLAVDQEVG